jgi:hypothetical protein
MQTKQNKTFFLETLGDTPQLRVMDFLIGNFFFDFPMTEIARSANVSYNSLKIFFNEFIDKGILIKTRRIGKSDYFKLNTDNSFVKNLMQLDWNLTKSNILQEENKPIEISKNKKELIVA